MLERYLEGDVPSPAELEHTLAVGVAPASVFPLVLWLGRDGGRDRPARRLHLRDRPVTRGSSRRRGDAAGSEQQVAADPNGQPLAFVFKTIADPYVGQLSLFKVLSGTVKPDDHLVEPARRARTSGCTRCSRCTAKSRTRHERPRGRHRRGGEAVRRPRPATRSRPRARRCASPASSRRRRCSRSRSGRARRPTKTSWVRAAPPAGGRPRARARAQRRDEADVAAGHR